MHSRNLARDIWIRGPFGYTAELYTIGDQVQHRTDLECGGFAEAQRRAVSWATSLAPDLDENTFLRLKFAGATVWDTDWSLA